MIYTLTLNPAVDYLVTLPELAVGAVNRCQSEAARWGGKGINVSIILSALGVPSVIMGVLGGFTGHAIRRGLKIMGMRTDFVELAEGFTRINIKISAGSGHTEIHGCGPVMGAEAIKELRRRLDRVGGGDELVLAGQPESPLAEDFYAGALTNLAGRGTKVILDAAGRALELALPLKPNLVKTNLEALSGLIGADLRPEDDLSVAEAAKALIMRGAENVLVSLGARGALLAAEDGRVLKASPPPGQLKDSYGAGDSLLAGFLAGRARGLYKTEALGLAAAAGAATAFTTGLADGPDIEALTDLVEIAEILAENHYMG